MDEVAARYRSFIDNEVDGSSEIYRDWADGIIEDADIRARLAVLPVQKQQPHLVFAAARFCGAPLAGYEIVGP